MPIVSIYVFVSLIRKVSCFEIDKHRFETCFNNIYPQRWKFIKEDKNVRKQEKTLSAKKTIKIKRKNRKKTHSTMKATKKKR